MTRHLLVVCTANAYRSPVTAAMLQHALDPSSRHDADRWVVRSAGTSPVRARIDPNTVAAAAVGVDITGHVAHHLSPEIVRFGGRDLVITMTRAHLREVVAMEPASRVRTFTLRELVRRATAALPAAPDEAIAQWLARIGAGRRAASMIAPDPSADIDDPYSALRAAHDALLDELTELVDALLTFAPWR